MTQTTTDNERTVAEVVEALLGPADDQVEPTGLEAQSARVASEVDARTAENYCRILLGHLADDPQSVNELEALLVLGLAHPSVFEANRIPLAQEGRRLAHLLERGGEPDRAQALLELIAQRTPQDRALDHDLASMMRRTGNADRLVERYMRRAEDCVKSGNTAEAISWLQEILLVDRSRRDVARMIRDLRWGDQEKRLRLKRAIRTAAAVFLLCAAVVAIVQRERDVGAEYAAVPEATAGDLGSLRQRLEHLDRLESEHPFSVRLFSASKERAKLKSEIAKLESQSAQRQISRRAERESQLAIAESARKQGRLLAQQNRLPEALESLERALAHAPADWDQRAQVMVDVDAIRQWIVDHDAANSPEGK